MSTHDHHHDDDQVVSEIDEAGEQAAALIRRIARQACPLCDGLPLQHHAPIIDQRLCYVCKPGEGVLRQLTGKHRTVDRADPTDSYELACGHWGDLMMYSGDEQYGDDVTSGPAPVDDAAIDNYVAAIDRIVLQRSGVSIHDLADYPFYDWMTDGITPAQAAQLALEAEGFGS